MSIHLDAPFDVAVRRTREALRQQGLSVIAEVDVQATLHEALGEHIENYLLLGVCDPGLTYRALTADRQAGLLLSCSVVVRSVDTGTLVEATDPELLVRGTQPALRPVAEDARRLLAAALESLREPAPA
ncbi:DUF302 domain-containing protein [Nocardia sp. NBC_00508]|nr:DUF302 domain-containing protein [Nocardia sp. NBC_00508]